MTALKTINSHAGYYRFLAELPYGPAGYITRVQGVPSPYASSPTDVVYDWKGKRVFMRETRHKYYQVFEVPAGVTIYQTDDAATEAYIQTLREKNKGGLNAGDRLDDSGFGSGRCDDEREGME
jgi:hypothetical protein